MSGEISVSDKIDRAFVFKLATRGKVRVLSHQVTIQGTSVDLTGIEIPAGCSIDWLGVAKTGEASVTFNFLGMGEVQQS